MRAGAAIVTPATQVHISNHDLGDATKFGFSGDGTSLSADGCYVAG